MTVLHFRYRTRLGLLASSALDPAEASTVLKHVEECGSCQRELAELRRTVASLATEAARDRPLPISSDALRTRVLARIRADSQPGARHSPWGLAALAPAAGLVGVGLIVGVLSTKISSPPSAAVPRLSQLEPSMDMAANDAAFYERLEKTHLRSNAARYLAEAQDVLIQVTAAADCPDSPKDSVDVTREAQVSRTLLRRRAALVSGSRGTLLAAQGVMEEVEGLLQQVADLPKCTRRTDVDAIARAVDRRNLLMKIDLVSQELAAP